MVITVTGSTGTIGSELVRLLSEAGAPTRGVYRSAKNTQALKGVLWLKADLRDEALLEPVLAGTTRLFLLSGNEAGFGKLQIEALRAAERLGVQHVVKLSALGASSHSNSGIAREHWEVEQAVQQSKMTWTILRPHSFMQNWLGEVAESVRADGAIYSPIADGRVPFIDTRDIAAVAAETLLNPVAHVGRRHFLTGGEAVGFADVAAALSEATGTPVRYVPISMDDARSRMQTRGVPANVIGGTMALYEYQKAGGPTANVSDSVERILGRSPHTIRDFARDYADHFARTAREVSFAPE
jgi:uncharacterized protein YbjT (DUF2867 family)